MTNIAQFILYIHVVYIMYMYMPRYSLRLYQGILYSSWLVFLGNTLSAFSCYQVYCLLVENEVKGTVLVIKQYYLKQPYFGFWKEGFVFLLKPEKQWSC